MVGEEVDPEWEINGVAGVVTANDGPAVLFEKVKGTDTAVLSELFGRSWRRVALAMNMETDDPLKIRNEWMSRLEKPLAPKLVETGLCKENVLIGDKANFDEVFPKVRWHEQDGGYYLGTLGMQVTASAETGEQNVGCYRMMYQDGVQAKLMMQPFQGGAQHLREWGRRCPDKPMPMAVVFGADPCYVLAGGSKFEQPPSEEWYAGALRQEAVELVRGKGNFAKGNRALPPDLPPPVVDVNGPKRTKPDHCWTGFA